jgi:ribosome biogenesis GTPase / thiamine phosphate phosphatase
LTEKFDALVPYGFSERVHALWNDRDHPDGDATAARLGRVVRVDGATCRVAVDAAVERPCRGRSPLAVGDWVAVEDDVVACVLPRWSAVVRADPSATGVQVLAANVDLVVVAAPADRLKAARVEREVTLAWESGARPLVAFTKSDLDDGHLLDGLRARVAGVDIVATSVRRGRGLDELAAELGPGRTGVLIGPSGAGKSTLVNALVGHALQAVGEVRAGDQRGRHTTTSRQLVCLPSGGALIDTPGLRSLGMAGGTRLGVAFPDIELLSKSCRFRDCNHRREPGCAVRRAVADGALDPGRLASFEKLAREAAAERRRSDPLEARATRRMWVQRRNDARRYDKRRWT